MSRGRSGIRVVLVSSAQESMMPAVSACPDRQSFHQFFAGKMSVPEVLRLEEHLEKCAAWRAALQESFASVPAVRGDDPVSVAVARVCSRYIKDTATTGALEGTR